MALPVVRSHDEANLYLELHPCERCESPDIDWHSSLTDDAGAPARRYHGTCKGCGSAREYVFRLPERPALPGPDDQLFFGGRQPSQLFDPGEWQLLAEAGVRDGGTPHYGAATGDAERKYSFALAVAAFGEILKFIPEGADAVPESAFWTPHGRAAYDENPDRFSRERLEMWQRNFREELRFRFPD